MHSPFTTSFVRLALLSFIVVACAGGGEGTSGPPSPSRIAATSSVTLSGPAGTAVATPPSVRVTSASGAGVAGVTVTFAVTAGGGTATGTTATTADNGIATVGSWTLGATVGTNTMTATAAGLDGSPVTFTATSTTGAPASIAFSRDSLLLDQWGDTGSVIATVRDAGGNPIASPSLVWSSPDTAVATVSAGLVRSVRAGRALVRVAATVVGFPTIEATIPARVALQRNPACIIPAVTSRGAATGVPVYSSPEIVSGLSVPNWPGSRTLPLDYDGDGDTDIIRLEYSFPGSNPYSGDVHVFRNDGGTLRDSTSVILSGTVVPDHPRDFEIADFTGDGVADLYVAQHGYDAAPFPGAPNLLLSRSGAQVANVASARFTGMSSGAFSHGSAAGDIDCDGDVDLVELNLNGNAGNAVWLNGGTGSFTQATSRAPLLVGMPAGQRWQETAFIDFDRDGDPDLYLGARSGAGWNEDVLLVNDGFGNFRRSTAVNPPAPAFSSAHGINNAKAADFDGDGRQDLILFEIPQPFSTSSAVRLWRNLGDGRFADVSTSWGLPSTCSGEVIEPLWVRDFNGDGWPDVALPGGCSNLGQGILFNTGTGFTMMPFSSLVSWLGFDIVTPIDINSDGKLDLLFADRGGDVVIVRRP